MQSFLKFAKFTVSFVVISEVRLTRNKNCQNPWAFIIMSRANQGITDICCIK